MKQKSTNDTWFFEYRFDGNRVDFACISSFFCESDNYHYCLGEKMEKNGNY